MYFNILESIKNKLIYLKESSIDFPKESLPKDIWDYVEGKFIIKDGVRFKILDALNSFPDFKLLELAKHIHIIGSSTGNLFDDDSDIDIHIVPDKDKLIKITKNPEKLISKIMGFYEKNRIKNNWFVNKHPFEVYLQLNNNQDLIADAVYDLLNNKWIKEPVLTDINYNPYDFFKDIYDEISKVTSKTDLEISSLRRNLIDYKTINKAISTLPTDSKIEIRDKLKNKLKDIENNIYNLAKDRQTWKLMRRQFSQVDSEVLDIKSMKLSKEWQDNNAIYKFLQRYLYIKLISNLEKFIEDKEVTDDEIVKVEKVLKKFYTEI